MSVEPTARASRYVVELQSVRGLAAAAVMVGHALNYYAMPEWFWRVSLLFNGRAAVVIFFVLSGYVLTKSLRRATLSPVELADFYVKRLFRIYPAIWAASLVGLAYLSTLHWTVAVPDQSAGVLRQFRADRMDALHIAASFAGVLAFILPQLWSVFVEIAASAAMPWIAQVAYASRRGIVALLAVAFVLGCLTWDQTYYNVGLYLLDFVVGAAVAARGPAIARSAPLSARGTNRWVVAVGAGLLLTQFMPLPYNHPAAHLVEIGLSAALVYLLAQAPAPVPILSSRSLEHLGDVSYSLYLLHYPVLCGLAVLLAVLEPLGLHLSLIPRALLLTGLTCFLTIPLSGLLFRFVELPGIRLGTWLRYHLSLGQLQASDSQALVSARAFGPESSAGTR